MDVAALIQLLGSFASIGSAIGQVIKARGKGDRAEILEKYEQLAPIRSSEATERAVASISPDVRKSLGEKLKRAKKDMLDVYNDPKSRPYDLQGAFNEASYDICHILELIKQHNRGKLPRGFDRLWHEFGCDGRP